MRFLSFPLHDSKPGPNQTAKETKAIPKGMEPHGWCDTKCPIHEFYDTQMLNLL